MAHAGADEVTYPQTGGMDPPSARAPTGSRDGCGGNMDARFKRMSQQEALFAKKKAR